MQRPFFQRLIASTVLIGAVLGTASVAHARPDVQVSIGLPGLPVLLPPPLPLPRPFFREQPVYVQPRVVYQAPPVVYERPWRPSYRYEAERDREWRHRGWERRDRDRHDHWDRSPHHDHRGRD
jgi:hypothetical protein